MSELVYKDVKIYVDGADMSGDHNQANLAYSADMLEKTTYGSSGKKRRAGLVSGSLSAQGYTNFSPSTGTIKGHFTNVGLANKVVSVCPTSDGGVGENVYFMKCVSGNYSPLQGTVGEIVTFDMQAESDDGLVVKGTVLAQGVKSSSGNGTGYQLGTPGTTKRLYGAIHITSRSTVGANIVGKIVASASSGFGSITTALTFTATSSGASFSSTTLGSTLTWHRAQWNPGSSLDDVGIAIHGAIK